MSPMEQLDIMKSSERVEDEKHGEPSERDLEVGNTMLQQEVPLEVDVCAKI